MAFVTRVRWGIFKKKDWKCLVIYETKEEADKMLKGKEHILEVREVYGE